MARNWTAAEAIKAIRKNETAAILDLGHRFPLFTVLCALTNDAGEALIATLPDYITARKMESVLKGEVQAEDVEDDEEEVKPEKKVTKAAPVVEAPAKKKAKPVVEEEEDEDDEPAPVKTKKKAKPAPVEEDEDEDDDDEEEEPAPKAKKKVAPAPAAPAKKAKKKAASDDEDWDL